MSDEESEVWKDVVGFEGLYEVSSHGRVRSLDRVTERNHLGTLLKQPFKGRLLSPGTSKCGHQYVDLSKNGEKTRKYAHEIVAAAFIGPRPEKHHVCHNDGNGGHNTVTNLRYDTPTGNAKDRHAHGTDAIGVNNPWNKHSEETVRRVKEALKSKSNADVSREFGMHPATVSAIRLGTRWGHIDV